MCFNKHTYNWIAISDVDECLNNNGGCLYYCENTIGSVYCDCPAGYKLAADGQFCLGKIR